MMPSIASAARSANASQYWTSSTFAAGCLSALGIALQTGIMGLVALHASQDNNGRVLNTPGLGLLNGSLTALLGRLLVTSANECGLLV